MISRDNLFSMRTKRPIDEYAELPYIVIDLLSLYNGHKFHLSRILASRKLWDNFNLFLFIEKGLFNTGNRKLRKLNKVYDLDFMEPLRLTDTELKVFLELHKALLLTGDPSLRERIGFRAIDCFDKSVILQNYKAWSRDNA